MVVVTKLVIYDNLYCIASQHLPMGVVYVTDFTVAFHLYFNPHYCRGPVLGRSSWSHGMVSRVLCSSGRYKYYLPRIVSIPQVALS